MSSKIKSLLLPFYVGAIDDTSRLMVERELLCDEEMLVDYFDLKRRMESAALIPNQPSPRLWKRLNGRIKPSRRFYISVAVSAAVAASLVLLSALFFQQQPTETSVDDGREILFDSSRELPANSNVL